MADGDDQNKSSVNPSSKETKDIIAREYFISDDRFIRELNDVHELCEFFRREIATVKPEDSKLLVLGPLGSLRGTPENARGRDATAEEWKLVEDRKQALYGLLDAAQRRAFYLRKSEAAIVWLPAVSALAAAAMLIGAVLLPQWQFTFYVFWLLLLGAMGSVAFIAMNALSLQKDITFDLTNKRLLYLRIVLGALFGLVLGVTFGFQQFVNFCKDIATIGAGSSAAAGTLVGATGAGTTGAGTSTVGNSEIFKQAVLLLLPFVLGFSTSLVILFLNKIIEAVEVILGKRTSSTPT